jgi:signal transduction histidine kinase/CheY-like chemotaxis protein
MRKDGTLFWANVVIDAIKNEQGNIIGFAKITRDITERREAQRARQEAEAELAHAHKMEALGQLTGGVAHDFNNLLMIISGHIQTIKKLVADEPKALRASEAIELAARRGDSLTRQLLTFARRQSLNPVVVGIGERIEAFRTMLANSVAGSAKLMVSIPADLWPVKVDVSEFELALVNLAVNARDAMGKGGVITIIAENVELQPGTVTQKLAGDFVAVTVADTGCGIPPDIVTRVFDPFFTTKQAGKGTGLGLSQVHGFAVQSGGGVTIQSDLGKGTRVTIYLPRSKEILAGAGAGAVDELSGAGKVLLVEDNPDVAAVTAGMLEQLGYKVTMATEAKAALQAIGGEKFDLVVSDIIMSSEMDGLALARLIRQRHPELPVLLVTGYSNSATPIDADFTVLRKPYEIGDLGRAATKVITEWRQPAASNLVPLRKPKRNRRDPSAKPEQT